MLLAVSAASVSAQTYQIRKDSVKTGEYSPTVYLYGPGIQMYKRV